MASARRAQEKSLTVGWPAVPAWVARWSWQKRIYNVRRVGVWRRLVAHSLGVRVVAGSNPATPTISMNPRKSR
jgi:hypothetical protein